MDEVDLRSEAIEERCHAKYVSFFFKVYNGIQDDLLLLLDQNAE